MSNRFHNKFHKHNHHTRSTDRTGLYPDSGYDPIASPEAPFEGEFYVDGDVTTLSGVSAAGDLYAQNAVFHGSVLVEGNMQVLGETTRVDTRVIMTSALELSNTGSGPALKVTQTGLQPLAWFIDNNGDDVVINNDGYVGLGTMNPNEKLTVVGNVSAVGDSRATGELHIGGNAFFSADSHLSGSEYIGRNLTVNDDLLIANASTKKIGINTIFPNVELTITGDVSATGDSSVGGNLDVGNNGLFEGSVWLSGNQTIDQSLFVKNKIGINTTNPNEALTVVGNVSATQKLDLDGNFSGKGNSLITGNTFVSGNSFIDGTIKIGTTNPGSTNNVATFDNNTVTTRAANYRIWDTTAEFLSGNQIGASFVPVYTGYNTLGRSIIYSNSQEIQIAGALSATGNIIGRGTASFSGALSAGGSVNITGALSARGDTTIRGSLSALGGLVTVGVTTLNGALSTSGTANIGSELIAGGNISTTGVLSARSSATVDGNVTTKANLTVTGNISAGGNTTVVKNLSVGEFIFGKDATKWNDLYTKVASVSSEWDTAYKSVSAGQSLVLETLDRTYTTVAANSANWSESYTYVRSTSAAITSNIVTLSAAIQRGVGFTSGTVAITGSSNIVNLDILDNTTLYYTESAVGPFVLNIRGNSTTPLDSVMEVGQVVNVKFINPNGATARQLYSFQVDGKLPTLNFVNGFSTSFPGSNANSTDMWDFTVIKKAPNRYNAIGNITRATPVQRTQLGTDIAGEATGDEFGTSVALNSAGNILAVGAPKNDGIGFLSIGGVRVYSWDHNSWNKLGLDIDGEAVGDESGTRISLNALGNRIAIGSPKNTSSTGSVKVYELSSSPAVAASSWKWEKLGLDIDGEVTGDEFGTSVSLNADGNILAVGAPKNDAGGSAAADRGSTRVYYLSSGSSYAASTWLRVGLDIDGDNLRDLFGTSVSLNAAGNVIAIGAPAGTTGTDAGTLSGGSVKVFYLSSLDLSSTGWIQRGAALVGEASFDQSGWSVSLNAEGNRVAIGALGNDATGINAGQVRTYEWDYIQQVWEQMGVDIDGEAAADQSGITVSLNGAGDRLAIGANLNDGNGINAGSARVYEWDSTNGINAWLKLCTDIDGEAASDESGYSVSLNGAGERVAIGARYSDEFGIDSGHVRVHQVFPNSPTPYGRVNITVQPIPLTVEANRPVVFTTAATTTHGPLSGLTYQWKENGIVVGQLSSTYVTLKSSLGTSNIKCVVKNTNYGTTGFTNIVSLNYIAPAVTITQQPIPVSVVQGLSYTFNVAASAYRGEPGKENPYVGFTYQWYKRNIPIAGATGPTYTSTDEEAGGYSIKCVAITTPYGSEASSNVVTLSVTPAFVTFSTQPISYLTAPQGVQLSATAIATVPAGSVAYEWKKDGISIPGANSNTYVFAETVVGTHQIVCVASNTTYGLQTESQPLELVTTPSYVTITFQPASTGGAVDIVKQQGVPSIFNIGAETPAGRLSFQWQKSTSPDFANTVVIGTDNKQLSGYYEDNVGLYYIRCVVTNIDYDKVTISNTATLTVIPAVVTIVSPPSNITRQQGVAATFSVIATTQAGTLSYQWKKNGTNVGTNSSTYTTSEDEIGTYGISCVVTNTTYGVSTTTSTAIMSVVQAVVTIASQPVSISRAQGYPGTFSVTATTQAGNLSYQWKRDGVDVGTNSSSYSLSDTVLGNYNIICIVTNTTYNVSTTTNTAVFTVVDGTVSIIAQPTRVITRGPGQIATFAVAGWTSAGVLSYQWFNSNGVAVTNNAIGNSSYTTSTPNVGTLSFYCVVTNATYGPTATSAFGSLLVSWSFPSSIWTLVLSNGLTNFTPNYDFYRDVAYGAGTWVLVGADGYISYSTTNGDTWLSASNGFNLNDINAVVYKNGLFMAVGENGTAYKSSNGITWTSTGALPANGNESLLGINYSNGVWVTHSSTGIWSSSNDGNTWSLRASNYVNLNSIATNGNGTWIIITGGQGNSLGVDMGQVDLISTNNGTSWSTLNMDIGGGENIGYAATLLDSGRLVADRTIYYAPTHERWYYSVNEGNIWQSVDGVNWFNVVNSINSISTRGVVEAPAGGIMYTGRFNTVEGNSTVAYVLSTSNSVYSLVSGSESQNIRSFGWPTIQSSIYTTRSEAPSGGILGVKKMVYGNGYWMAIEQPSINNYNRISRSPILGAYPIFSVNPTTTTVSQSGIASFSALASTTTGGTLSYQWFKNETLVGTGTSYSVNERVAGTYAVYCAVRDSITKITSYSTIATLTVTDQPITIVSQPSSTTNLQGTTATFTTSATSLGGVLYQWLKDGTPISGATTNSVSVTETVPGLYSIVCRVTNAVYGSIVNTNAAILTVTADAISVTSPIVSRTVEQGVSATYSIGATGTYPITYQWKKDGVNIGTNSNTVTVTENAVGTYTIICELSNQYGNNISRNASLTVTTSVVNITSQPANVPFASTYQPVTFSVGATTGAGTLSYQWKKDGVNTGTNSSSLTITETVATTFLINCIVTNTTFNVSATSNTALLTLQTSEFVLDPYFTTSELTLNGDVTDINNNSAFLDNSPNALILTRTGNVTQTNLTPFSPYGWSGYFSNSSYVSFDTKAASVSTFNTAGDYTMECWVYPTSYSGTIQETFSTNIHSFNYQFAVNVDGLLAVTVSDWGFSGAAFTATSNKVPLNTWTHVVVQRRGGSMAFFVNGTQTAATNTFYGGYLTISPDPNSPYYSGPAVIGKGFNGYMSNFRFTKQALYLGPFAPSTIALTPTTNGNAGGNVVAPLTASTLLIFQNNQFTDNSP